MIKENRWTSYVENIQKNKPFENIQEPKFYIENGEKIFTIGSCFARNIEEVLENKFNFPILTYEGNDGEYRGKRKRGILNKFTPETILWELEWLVDCLNHKNKFRNITDKYFKYVLSNNNIIDTGLQQFISVSDSRFYERREEIYEIYKQLKESDSVIITFGLIEQFYLNSRPIQHAMNNKEIIQNEIFKFKLLDIKKTEKIINKIIVLIKQLNPNIKLILTVSPVPLEKTFSKNHILIANTYSKSTLRVALEKYNKIKNVDYFPSFEMVSAYGANAFENDLRHVRNEIVNYVFNIFSNLYEAKNV